MVEFRFVLGFGVLVGDAADALFDQWDVEVDQEAEGLPGEFQISHELGLVHWQGVFDCLQFDYDALFTSRSSR